VRRVRPLLLAVALALLAPGVALCAREGYLGAKARLAAALVDRAWRATRDDGLPHRPWAWADMHPIARLRVPRLGVVRPILSNAAGSSLAFGLGHVDGTAPPGGDGTSAIAGHRDSWAAFLERIRIGDEVVVETRAGDRSYRVDAVDVVRSDRTDVLAPGADDRLLLVTCWPFGGLVGGPWRYVVRCGGR